MAVYVDPLIEWGWVMYGKRVPSCHLLADDIEELHSFAKKIGLKKSWFQDKRYPHYDLVKSKRELAITQGAIELDREGLRDYFKRNPRKKKGE